MTYIVFFALLLLITLLASYLIVENNRKKAIEAKKKLFNARVSQVNTRLKLKLNELLDAKLIRPKYLPRIQAIVSNFLWCKLTRMKPKPVRKYCRFTY